MHFRLIFEALSDLSAPGDYMRYYRQLGGLTTRQLAEKLNIVPATVLGYEQCYLALNDRERRFVIESLTVL